MKVIATVEARMGSSRLPGKVMLPLAGKPMIIRLVERVARSQMVNEVVVATTDQPSDQIIIDTCNRYGVKVVAGSELDITQRLLDAAGSQEADIVVQLTGDNPLVDPELIDNTVRELLDSQSDYVTNYKDNNLTIGFNVRCFTYEALEKAAELCDDLDDRMHGSYYIHRSPELFSISGVSVDIDLQRNDIRLTVDETSDFEIIRRIFETLYPLKQDFTARDVIEVIDRFPEWKKINEKVEQKKPREG